MPVKSRGFCFLFLITLLLRSPSVFANSAEDQLEERKTEEGKALCKTHWNKQDPQDPCNEAHLMDVSQDATEVAAVGYSALAGVCWAACGYPPMAPACTAAVLGGAAFDVGATIAIGLEGGNLATQMASLLPTLGSLVALPSSLSTKTVATKTVETIGEDAEVKNESTYERAGSCISAATMSLNVALRWVTYFADGDSRDAAYRKKVDLMPKDIPLIQTLAENSNGGNSIAGNGGPVQNDANRNLANTVKEETKKDFEKFAESAATAGFGPGLKKFEEITGKPVSELFDKIANKHLDPFTALAKTAGTAISPMALQALGEVAAASKAIADKNKAKILLAAKNKQNADSNFALTGNGRSGSNAKANLGMPDFSKLMAGLLPKKPEKAEEAVNGNLGFSKSNQASVSKEGFHSAEKSIFDIVGLRYQNVQTKFLTGASVIDSNRAPSSLVPANPYLKK